MRAKSVWFIVTLFLLSQTPVYAQTIPRFERPHLVIEPSGAPDDLAYDRRGERLAAALQEGVLVWDTTTARRVLTIRTQHRVTRLKYSTTDDLLLMIAQASVRRSYLLVANADGRVTHAIDYGVKIRDFDLAPDGDTLALILDEYSEAPSTRLRSQKVAVTSLRDAMQRGTRTYRQLGGDNGNEWNTVTFDASGKYVAAGAWYGVDKAINKTVDAEDTGIRVWSLADGQETHYAMPDNGVLTQILFSPDGTAVFGAAYKLVTWTLADGTATQADFSAHGFDLGIAVGGNFLAVRNLEIDNYVPIEHRRGHVTLRDWRTGEVVAYFRRTSNVFGSGSSGLTNLYRRPVAIRADGTQLALPDPGGVISLWNLDVLLTDARE